MLFPAIALLAFFASIFGTITGFGTSMLMVPILSVWFSIPEVLIFVGIIHWFGNLWKMLLFKKGVDLKLILLFGVPGVIFSYLGASLSSYASEAILQKFLAFFLLLDAVFILYKPEWEIKETDINALLGGGLSGLFAGIFGIGGGVRGAFLGAFNLHKSVHIFTSGAIAFFVDSARLLRYFQDGVQVSLPNWLLGICILVSFLGALVAKYFVSKMTPHYFRVVIGLGLLFAGMVLLF